jgi:hypothetical protein
MIQDQDNEGRINKWCIRHVQGYNHGLLTYWREVAHGAGLLTGLNR